MQVFINLVFGVIFLIMLNDLYDLGVVWLGGYPTTEMLFMLKLTTIEFILLLIGVWTVNKDVLK